MVDAFSVVALIAVSAQLSILVALHVLPTKYDPVHDAISDYGVGDYRRYFWAQLVAGAVAVTKRLIAAATNALRHALDDALAVITSFCPIS